MEYMPKLQCASEQYLQTTTPAPAVRARHDDKPVHMHKGTQESQTHDRERVRLLTGPLRQHATALLSQRPSAAGRQFICTLVAKRKSPNHAMSTPHDHDEIPCQEAPNGVPLVAVLVPPQYLATMCGCKQG